VALGEHGAGGVVHRGQQIDLPAVVAFGPRSVLPSTATARRRCCWPGRSRSASQAPITAASAIRSTRASARPIVPIDASARRSVELVPAATQQEDPGAPHGLAQVAPTKDQFNADLLDFLNA
jgi:hypothetical protein